MECIPFGSVLRGVPSIENVPAVDTVTNVAVRSRQSLLKCLIPYLEEYRNLSVAKTHPGLLQYQQSSLGMAASVFGTILAAGNGGGTRFAATMSFARSPTSESISR